MIEQACMQDKMPKQLSSTVHPVIRHTHALQESAPPKRPRGHSARCGNGLFAQCVRLRSEINPGYQSSFIHRSRDVKHGDRSRSGQFSKNRINRRCRASASWLSAARGSKLTTRSGRRQRRKNLFEHSRDGSF